MLWKKESEQKDAAYADLFDFPSIDSIYNGYEKMNAEIKRRFEASFKKSAAEALKYRQKGNEVFAEKKWIDATEWYNKSMCSAEEGSELMGLAYANRASCFFNMQMYSKCLVDIENAIQNNYPEEKMAKLDERKTICLATMEKKTDQSGVFEPKLDYAPNEMFPCFADVLQIENNREYGRHIMAKEDIGVGKTVMVDQSYVAEMVNQKYRRCNICLRSAENLKPCDKCTFAMICPRCESNNFHDIECNVNPTYFLSGDFMSYRMVMVSSILLAVNAFPDIDQLIAVVEEMLSSDAVKVPESLTDPQSKYRAFFNLQTKPKEQVDEKLPQKIYLVYRLLMSQSKVSTFFHSKAHKRFLIHLIGHHIIVMENCNRDIPCEIACHGDGIELFLQHRMSIPASYFNHSCAPNAYITSQNGINTCVVIRPVRKGEQLCVAYNQFNLMNPKAERQEAIRSRFNFQCKCIRCEQPQLEASCLKSSQRIKSDPDFLLIPPLDTGNLYQEILRLKADSLGLLKKYEKEPWCEEIYSIITNLRYIALAETDSASAVPCLDLPCCHSV